MLGGVGALNAAVVHTPALRAAYSTLVPQLSTSFPAHVRSLVAPQTRW
jgi:hypothetical protein